MFSQLFAVPSVLKILTFAFWFLRDRAILPDENEKKRTAMQIILQEDVEKLGTRGEVVEVAAGYARN